MFSVIFNIMQVEFNKAAQSLTEAVVPSAQKKTALSRLVKVVCFALIYQNLCQTVQVLLLMKIWFYS